MRILINVQNRTMIADSLIGSMPLSVLALSLVGCLLAAAPIRSDTEPPATGSTVEPVLIRTLLEGATSYQGHTVAVMGKARGVEVLPPLPGGKKCKIMYDSYVFTVEDESGTIRVEVRGACGTQGQVDVIREGELVFVEGMFVQLVSGNFSSPSPLIHAWNRKVRRLPE